jgi:hypothetical protein
MLKKKLLSRSREMTLPDERYRAVTHAGRFLVRLASGEFPRVPKAVRDEARALLRHYPNQYDMDRAARACPDVFVERYEDLHRFVLQAGRLAPTDGGEQQQEITD